nr:CD109 antigen-like [Onthophagus taurus]
MWKLKNFEKCSLTTSAITVLLLVLCVCSTVKSQGIYKISCSKILRPNSEFHVSISLGTASLPIIVETTITGNSFKGKVFSAKDTIKVSPNSSKLATLQIADIEDGVYSLLISGSGGVTFEESIPKLRFLRKSFSVLIQTDKPVYKPGDLIQFRTIILGPSLRPSEVVRNKPVRVHITDGRGNKVKEWMDVYAPRGVFNAEVRLSNSPVLGNWNITVVVQGQTYTKRILIAEYVLPKFLLKIDAPNHVSFQENIIVTDIEANYDYGKKVQGDATVTVYPTIISGVIQPIYENPIRKVVPIDGKTTVNIDIARELGLNNEYERTVVVDVTVQEALTGLKQNNSIEIQLRKYDYKVEIIKTADYFKPGMLYTVYIKVSNYNGYPLEDSRKTIKVNYGFSRNNENFTNVEKKINQFGVATLELYMPVNVTEDTMLRIEAEYLDLKEIMSPVLPAISPSKTFMQLYLESEKHAVNKDVIVLVNCTEPMSYITYEVLGRGDILLTKTQQVDNRRVFKFAFSTTHTMVPIVRLLVSYIRDDGEIVSDSVNIEIDGLLQNFVQVETTSNVGPSFDVDFTIKTQPHSYVGLTAVDEKLNKIGTNYEIDRNSVIDELEKYDAGTISPYSLKSTQNHFIWKPGSSNTRSMFEDSGVILITNGKAPMYEAGNIFSWPASFGSSTLKPERGAGSPASGATRPPLAGPYAFSRIPRPVSDKPKIYLSDIIQETWLFTNFSSSYDGQTMIRKKLPSSITNWKITAFSLNFAHGLGLITQPLKIEVSKQFSVNVNLPKSIQRGEVLLIPVVVFNNLDQDITAEVLMHNPDQKFDFEGASNKKIELYRKKKLAIKKQSKGEVSFMIIPNKLGETPIRIEANSQNMQDTIEKILIVKPEGETEFYTKSILIDLRGKQSFKGNLTINLPENVVEGSTNIEISTVSDLLGPLIINLGNLIRLPTSCGEQNLLNFVSNTILLNYLRNTGQLSPTIEQDAIKNLEISYQQQLFYKLADNSFGVFGKANELGNIWITSYTILAFIQAKPYIFIDDNLIRNGLNWLSERQNQNGGFAESGTIIYDNPQNSIALTSFVLMAFIENRFQTSLYANLIQKGLAYIQSEIHNDVDTYSLAIATYVMHLAKHPAKENLLNLLNSKAITGNDIKWWTDGVLKNDSANPWVKLSKTADIEITSYALLSMLEADLITDTIPVVNWLMNQGNSLGGFTSSHDTKAALMALYRMVLRFSTQSNMKIQYEYNDGLKKKSNDFYVNQNNAMIVQRTKISNDAKVVNITAEGNGLSLIRISYQYNKNVTGAWPMFTLDPQVHKNSNQYRMQLTVCTGFVSKNLSDTTLTSNMAIIEVNLPSGFTADTDSLPSLEASQNVQKVETGDNNRKIFLYFNNITHAGYCPTISAFRTYRVAKEKPAAVLVYDYYDSSRRARIFYSSRRTKMGVCDICENDCNKRCSNEPNLKPLQDGDNKNGKSKANQSKCFINLLLVLVLISLNEII